MIILTQASNRPVITSCGGDTITSQVASGNRKALENSDISQAWFTTRDEKDALHSKGITKKKLIDCQLIFEIINTFQSRILIYNN